MSKKGLNPEVILNAAVTLVEEEGYDNLSLRMLAARLGVKPSSLYNHIEGAEQLNLDVAVYAAEQLNEVLAEAIRLNEIRTYEERDAAFIAGVNAFRQYATEHRQLYRAISHLPYINENKFSQVSRDSFRPIRRLVNSYNKDHMQTLHYCRALRSFIHGYADLTATGFFRYASPTQEESYDFIVLKYLELLKGLDDKREEV